MGNSLLTNGIDQNLRRSISDDDPLFLWGTGPFVASIWAYSTLDSLTLYQSPFACVRKSASDDGIQFGFLYFPPSDGSYPNRLRFNYADTAGTSLMYSDSTELAGDNTWHHFCIGGADGVVYHWVDSVIGSDTDTRAYNASTHENMWMNQGSSSSGSTGLPAAHFQGYSTELVMASGVELTPTLAGLQAWVDDAYNSGNPPDPSTLDGGKLALPLNNIISWPSIPDSIGSNDFVAYNMTEEDNITTEFPTTIPVAAFSGTPTSGASPLTVQFTDSSSGSPTSWLWDFGDGSDDSTDQNPEHIYTTDISSESFTVTLTATNDSGSDDEVKTDYITATNAVTGTDIKAALRSYLTLNAGVYAQVEDRIYSHIVPTSEPLPYITYTRIASPSIHHMTAASGIVRDVFQFDCWGATDDAVFLVSEALRLALDGLTRTELGDVFLIVANNTTQRDNFNKPDDGSEIGTHLTSVDYDIWYNRSVPTF